MTRETEASDPFELPEFVREAGAEDPVAVAEVMGGMAALSGAPVSPRSRERLLDAVRDLPMRYAPFSNGWACCLTCPRRASARC